MEKVKLCNIVSINKGKQINGRDLVGNGQYEFLNGGVNPSGKWNDFNVMENSITISEGGNSCGYINFMKNKFWCGAHCYYLYDVKGEVKYLYYNLKSNEEKIKTLRSGACMPNIRKNDLLNFEIEYTSDIYEQKQIVNKLDKIQEIIDIRKKQIEQLDELIKSQFIEMFGDPVLNDKKWKTKTIGKCCTLKSGNSLSTEVENEGGDVLYVKVGDMNLKGNEKYITTSSHKVTEKTAGKGIFELGTVLFPKRGGAIGTNKKRLTNSKVCADLNIMGVTPIKEIISEYLFIYFLFIDLGTLNNGSSVPQINNKDIEPLIIQIPPIEFQNQFAYIVEQINKKKNELQKSLEEIKKLQESLMNKYFE